MLQGRGCGAVCVVWLQLLLAFALFQLLEVILELELGCRSG